MFTKSCGFKITFSFFIIFGITVLFSNDLIAQEYPGYDELSVEMNVPEMGLLEVPVAIKGETAYISVIDLFNTFRLKNEYDNETGNIQGYLIDQESNYLIDIQNKNIQFKDKSLSLTENDFIKTLTTLYLRSDLFSEIFGLNTKFSFRELAITFDTEIELPVIKEKRRERVRGNINRVRGKFEADTSIAKKYPFLKGGILDWGINTTQQTRATNDNRFNLGFGGFLAGGETTIQLNYSNRIPFTSRNQFYQWRHVNNDNKVFRQVTLGKIFTGATSSLFAPVVGVQLTNSPLQNRRAFGTYVLNDYTEPRWTVELYVNNVLVDYTKADATGFYTFDVPLMYGNTNVNLRFYGPYGEEQSEDRIINIPYTFVPKNKLEYRLSTGIVEDDKNRKFSRLDLDYGISNGFTIGGGVEYLSETESGDVMPFVSTSISLASNLLFSGEYSLGVKGEGTLSYRTPKSMQFDLTYAKYHEDQTAINYNYLEERKLSFTSPLRTKLFTAYSRFSFSQIILPSTEFMTAQFLLSGNLFGISTNFSTFALYNDRLDQPTIYSTVGQTYRLPEQFLFSPRLQYDISQNTIRNINIELERVMFNNGYANLSFEKNFLRNAYTVEIGFRYTFDFAQAALTSRIGNRNSSFIQSARGSVRLDDNAGDFMFNYRPGLTRGGLTLIPFLDLNNNGKKDEMEPKVPGLKLESNNGLVSYNEDKTILRINDLQPYLDMNLKIDETSLDNIAWKIQNPNIVVETVANYYKSIYIPVKVLGEASGYVYLTENGQTNGIGRILVNIRDENGALVKNLLTEGDGYFYHLGLPAGNYTASIDEDQLIDLGFRSSGNIEFEIEVSEFGDIVDNLEFILKKDQ